MHCTLPPLLGSEVMSLLVFLVMGKAAADLRPVNGATMLACAGEAAVATAADDENMEEAITVSCFVCGGFPHHQKDQQ